MAIIPAIKKRHSIRQYLPKEIPEEMILEVLKAGMFAPSAMNSRPWEFIVSKEPKKFLSLTKWTKALETSSAVIIVIADTKKSHHWVEDCSASVENMMLQAEELGLGTCWVQIHHSSETEAETNIRKMLSIPNHYGVLCMLAIGFPSVKKPEHSEAEFEQARVHDEKF